MTIRIAVFVAATASVLLGQRPTQAQWVENEAIVKFKRGQEAKALGEISGVLNATMIRPIGGAGAYLVRSSLLSTAAILQALKVRGDVLYAEPNALIYAQKNTPVTPNDPDFKTPPPTNLYLQTGLTPYGTYDGVCCYLAGISAESAWGVTTGTSDVVVGVLDFGVEFTHPDLTDQYGSNIWSAPGQFTVHIGQTYPLAYDVTCPAGSHGFNSEFPSLGIPGSCNNSDLVDYSGHGTGVAGIIGARGNNGIGVAGINWNSSVMILKRSGWGTEYPDELASEIDLVEFAIQAKASEVAHANVRVLNGSFSQIVNSAWSFRDEIVRAGDNGILYVGSAGNGLYNEGDDGINVESYNWYPPDLNTYNQISVAGSDAVGWGLIPQSNWGPNVVHLAAPWTAYTTDVNGTYYPNDFTGTSASSPYVAGTAALALSRASALSKAMDVNSLKATVLDSVNVDSALLIPGWYPPLYRVLTGGHLDAYKAVSSHASSNAFFVHLTFLDLLHRSPDQASLTFWTGQGLSTASLISAFLAGPNAGEFASNGGFVISVYKTVYGWDSPDYAGWWYWLGQIFVGLSPSDLLAAFTGPNMSDSTFVSTIYQNAFGQTPSQAQINAMTGYLATNSRADLILCGAGTGCPFDFQAQIHNRIMVDALYLGLLRQGPDSNASSWKSQLDGGTSLATVVNSFITSMSAYSNRYY